MILYEIQNLDPRDFAKEERAQAWELGLTKQVEVERAAAFLVPVYEDPPAYEP